MEEKAANPAEMELQGDEEQPKYRSPQIFYVGEAVDLVQGRNYGKYNDGYSGYYWER